MSKQLDKQFKENAVQYYLSHKELGLKKCAENLGISRNALRNWVSAASENSGEVPTRGAGNYASDQAKENAMLKKEQLREEGKRRLNVSEALRILGVSRSGYAAFKKHVLSVCQTKKERRMKEIREIYEESHGIYEAPKIAEKMCRDGDRISDKTGFSSELNNLLDRGFHPGSPCYNS